ncbi:MAG: hypothetical protein QOJ58_181 [Alphaproteobacteria bacterium]|nr:hypothetical protein [Alphaproteobacteria bacterium]
MTLSAGRNSSRRSSRMLSPRSALAASVFERRGQTEYGRIFDPCQAGRIIRVHHASGRSADLEKLWGRSRASPSVTLQMAAPRCVCRASGYSRSRRDPSRACPPIGRWHHRRARDRGMTRRLRRKTFVLQAVRGMSQNCRRDFICGRDHRYRNQRRSRLPELSFGFADRGAGCRPRTPGGCSMEKCARMRRIP